ncbi:MAG TPA: L-aspartate oxidase, partial [Ruminococcaceae bacterium]|nr:L-aspartate oxidase [Oscillospiraceae bacterium]
MRRYLFSGDVKFNSTITTDVLIVGSGIAGLYAALCLDGKLKCTVLAKEGIKDSDSYLAQGGVAAALSADDTPCLHFQDTLEA